MSGVLIDVEKRDLRCFGCVVMGDTNKLRLYR